MTHNNFHFVGLLILSPYIFQNVDPLPLFYCPLHICENVEPLAPYKFFENHFEFTYSFSKIIIPYNSHFDRSGRAFIFKKNLKVVLWLNVTFLCKFQPPGGSFIWDLLILKSSRVSITYSWIIWILRKNAYPISYDIYVFWVYVPIFLGL